MSIHRHCARRVYTPVGTHRPNGGIREEYTVLMTYPNTNRLTGVVRPIFY